LGERCGLLHTYEKNGEEYNFSPQDFSSTTSIRSCDKND
jgi:hypothetical protein